MPLIAALMAAAPALATPPPIADRRLRAAAGGGRRVDLAGGRSGGDPGRVGRGAHRRHRAHRRRSDRQRAAGGGAGARAALGGRRLPAAAHRQLPPDPAGRSLHLRAARGGRPAGSAGVAPAQQQSDVGIRHRPADPDDRRGTPAHRPCAGARLAAVGPHAQHAPALQRQRAGRDRVARRRRQRAGADRRPRQRLHPLLPGRPLRRAAGAAGRQPLRRGRDPVRPGQGRVLVATVGADPRPGRLGLPRILGRRRLAAVRAAGRGRRLADRAGGAGRRRRDGGGRAGLAGRAGAVGRGADAAGGGLRRRRASTVSVARPGARPGAGDAGAGVPRARGDAVELERRAHPGGGAGAVARRPPDLAPAGHRGAQRLGAGRGLSRTERRAAGDHPLDHLPRAGRAGDTGLGDHAAGAPGGCR